jgi:hypothetical protein
VYGRKAGFIESPASQPRRRHEMRSVIMSKDGTTTPVHTSSRVLNIALWILQVLLVALFLWHGQFMVL